MKKRKVLIDGPSKPVIPSSLVTTSYLLIVGTGIDVIPVDLSRYSDKQHESWIRPKYKDPGPWQGTFHKATMSSKAPLQID